MVGTLHAGKIVVNRTQQWLMHTLATSTVVYGLEFSL